MSSLSLARNCLFAISYHLAFSQRTSPFVTIRNTSRRIRLSTSESNSDILTGTGRPLRLAFSASTLKRAVFFSKIWRFRFSIHSANDFTTKHATSFAMPESHEYTVTTTFGTSGFAIANEHAEKALLIEISSSVALGDLWEYVFARTSGAHSLVRLQQLLDVPTVHYAVC